MAIYASDMIDELRDYLDDATDTDVAFATKLRYLNRGQAAMYPKVFVTARDSTLTYDVDIYEYTIPAAVAHGKIILVELESTSTSSRFVRLNEYEIVPASANASSLPLLVFSRARDAQDGGAIRITAANPLTAFTSANYAASQAETYTGPAYTMELPVFFAMSQIMARVLDKRMDFGRFSVQNQNATANPIDIMSASQYWMDRYDKMLEQMQMPLPSSGI